MSKELDAFKGLLNQLFPDYNVDVSFDNICNLNANLNIISNALKALEIIKNKEINVHALLLHLKRFDNPLGYNALIGEKYQITQEDFDLLKEVLL